MMYLFTTTDTTIHKDIATSYYLLFGAGTGNGIGEVENGGRDNYFIILEHTRRGTTHTNSINHKHGSHCDIYT